MQTTESGIESGIELLSPEDYIKRTPSRRAVKAAQDEAVEEASKLKVMGVGTSLPVFDGMEVTFSDGSVVRMSKDQYLAIKALR